MPVNGYRWIRGFNEYDNWQASGVSGQGARSFYYLEAPLTCNDCHMPLVRSDDPAAGDGYVRSHRFPGANTALPFVNGDEEQLRIVQDFLRAGQISVDVFGITRAEEAPAPRAPDERGPRSRGLPAPSRWGRSRPASAPGGVVTTARPRSSPRSI